MTGLSAIEQLQASAAAAESPSLGPTIVPTELSDTLKHEDTEMAEEATLAEPMEAPVVVTTRAGRQSKTATPMSGTFPSELAPGPRNRSARTQKEKDNNSISHSHASSESGERTSGRRRKPANSAAPTPLGPSATAMDEIDPDTELPGVEGDETAELEGDEDEVGEEEEGEGGEGEPKYCYCNDVSYGEMVACDNEACAREWFHLKCARLVRAPDENSELMPLAVKSKLRSALTFGIAKWYCDDCKVKMGVAGAGIKRVRPAVRRD